MLIGIMGDSHDNLPKVRDAVALMNDREIGLVLHTGDYIAPFVIPLLGALKAPMIGVFGNNDGDRELLLKRSIQEVGIEIRGNFAELNEGNRCSRPLSLPGDLISLSTVILIVPELPGAAGQWWLTPGRSAGISPVWQPSLHLTP
jgi:hypothetical protein